MWRAMSPTEVGVVPYPEDVGEVIAPETQETLESPSSLGSRAVGVGAGGGSETSGPSSAVHTDAARASNLFACSCMWGIVSCTRMPIVHLGRQVFVKTNAKARRRLGLASRTGGVGRRKRSGANFQVCAGISSGRSGSGLAGEFAVGGR